MGPNRKARKARIVKVVASGACRLVRVRAGLELRVYRSKEEAIDDGVRPEKVKMLFAGRKLLGLCRMWVQSDGTLQCMDSGNCDGNCYIIEDSKVLPRPPYLGKNSQRLYMKPGSVYGCKCTGRVLHA